MLLTVILAISICIWTVVVVRQLKTNSNYNKEPIDSSAFRTINLASQHYTDGKALFIQHCAACHPPPDKHYDDERLINGIFDRLPAPADSSLKVFLRDERSLRDTGNPYYRSLAVNFHSTFTHNYKDSLTNAALEAIIFYIKLNEEK